MGRKSRELPGVGEAGEAGETGGVGEQGEIIDTPDFVICNRQPPANTDN